MRMRRVVAASTTTVFLAGSAMSACAPPPVSCTDLFAYGLTVIVTDSTTGERICDATVTVTDGAFAETLEPPLQSETCAYVGAGERAGTYRVEATKPEFVGDVAD